MFQLSQQPLLFLDIDGTVIPFGRPRMAQDESDDAYLAQVDPQLGSRLKALPCQLVWASAWEDEANAEVSPLLGLPKLQVIRWMEPTSANRLESQWFHLHWKTRTLVHWAAGRPFVWADDEITEADEDWVAANHRGSALLLAVNASSGLTAHDLDTIEVWLKLT